MWPRSFFAQFMQVVAPHRIFAVQSAVFEVVLRGVLPLVVRLLPNGG